MERNVVLMVLRQGRPVSTYPSVVNAARLWKEAGRDVDIITNTTNDVPDLFRRFHPFSGRSFPGHMAQVMGYVMRTRPSVVIAYEPIDAELCSLLPRLHAARYIYHNIELRYPGRRYFRTHQTLERTYFRHCDTVICQDELRMSELKRLLGAQQPGSREYLVPNTYLREPMPSETRYWHNRFGLADDMKVLLYAGAIERKKLPPEVVAKLLDAMPSDWCLALSGWSVMGYAEELQEIYERKYRTNRLIVVKEILPEREFLISVASSTAGLVWYEAKKVRDENEYNVGLSSGKFWRFITLGKQCLVNNRPVLGDYVRAKGLGQAVTDLAQIERVDFSALAQPLTQKYWLYYESYYDTFINESLTS